MPKRKEEIFEQVMSKISSAVQQLKSFGCSVGLPRVQDFLLEASGLLSSLTNEERNEFDRNWETIAYVIDRKGIRCDDISKIEKELSYFRDWKIKGEVTTLEKRMKER